MCEKGKSEGFVLVSLGCKLQFTTVMYYCAIIIAKGPLQRFNQLDAVAHICKRSQLTGMLRHENVWTPEVQGQTRKDSKI